MPEDTKIVPFEQTTSIYCEARPPASTKEFESLHRTEGNAGTSSLLARGTDEAMKLLALAVPTVFRWAPCLGARGGRSAVRRQKIIDREVERLTPLRLPP